VNYERWRELKRKMAVISCAMDMQEMMVPKEEAIRRAEQMRDASDNAVDQGKASVQRWRDIEYNMGNALIALEEMGLIK